ncbi:MAG TPA: alkaline phosphatase family protein [Opitutus sp.]|nr:alkaline phosphatase family protein [Opitutus sp.]
MPALRRILGLVVLATVLRAPAATLPRYDHVVVVIEENHAFHEILGPDSPAPYLRFLAAGGVALAQYFAVTHPSQPNYLALFAGSTHGVTTDFLPAGTPFTTPNLGAALLAKGFTFGGFSQSLPQIGYSGGAFTTAPGQHQYERKHSPWVNWQSVRPGPNQLPTTTNLPFENTFPTRPDADFTVLPTVAFVIPDERFDMHDGSIAAADEWLRAHFSAYATWARSHNSLLIVTFDEDDGSEGNCIPTLFYGAHLRAGVYREKTGHYGLLRTLEDMYGLEPAGASASAAAITDVFADTRDDAE